MAISVRGTLVAAALLALGIASGSTWGEAADPVLEAEARARSAAAALAVRLQARLTEALSKGGPESAIVVCAEDAQRIAREVSGAGMSVRRVSTKPRNPLDRPDPFELAILEKMETVHEGGANPEEHSEVVESDGVRRFRYLKPIFIGKACLRCHGKVESISPEVAETLAGRYPEDQALGYVEGDFRGAFSVTIPLD